MPVSEDLLEEQKINITPKERLKTFLLSDTKKDEIDIITDFQLKSHTASQFNMMVNNIYDNYEKLVAIFSEKMFKELSIHPNYGKYFASVWEEKSNPSIDIFGDLKIYGLSRDDMSGIIEKIMEWLREIYPIIKVYMDISRTVNDKYNMAYPDVPELVRKAKEEGMKEYATRLPKPSQIITTPTAKIEDAKVPEAIMQSQEPIPIVVHESKPKSLLIWEAKQSGMRNKEISVKFGIPQESVPSAAKYGEKIAMRH